MPVFLGIGIGIYFGLSFEPNFSHYILLFVGAAALIVAARFVPENAAPITIAISLICFGVILAGVRSHSVAAPVLSFRYYGPIQGRIVKMDRSVSEATRFTLDQVVLDNMAPKRTPKLVRISLNGEQGYITPEIGMTVITTGHLSPPSGPVEPRGFNFRKMAWFQGLGGVGYTRSPVLALVNSEGNRAGLFIRRLRRQISTSVQNEILGEEGAFAAAILTGDRSDMSGTTLQNLRSSNLAHLLAISGLHMGMLTGFVFASVRMILALFPTVSMRLPVKKISAVVAILFGAGYLGLSGGNVATQRAFIMVAVMFLAILLNRHALTLRAVAIAAIIILILRPESLTGPGFQMSFAATAALVAVFGALRDGPTIPLPKPLRVVLGVVLSSFVAGMATAPIAAVHFNQIAQYGLIANVLTVPLMGALVMPAAVIAILLAPFGLYGVALEVMRWGIWWILTVATYISNLEGATRMVVTPDALVLPLVATGGLILIIWRGKGRLIGIPILAASFFLWSQTERPDILIADTGTLVGAKVESKRTLNKAKGAGFVADSWLENDGDKVAQSSAFERKGFAVSRGVSSANVNGLKLLQLSGKGALDRVEDGCRANDIVISSIRIDPIKGCTLYDLNKLTETGSIAIYTSGIGLRTVTAHEIEGIRMWSPAYRKRRPLDKERR